MKIDRRELLIGAGALAATACASRLPVSFGAFGAAPKLSPAVAEAIHRAIESAKRAGASYVDARVVRRKWETVSTREDHIEWVSYRETYGIGVRVIVNGAWGFSSASRVDGASAESAALRAVVAAAANAHVSERPVVLAPAPLIKGSWVSPCATDPFAISVAEKGEYLIDLWRSARSVPGAKFGAGHITSLGEWKVFASSEGSLLEQKITRIAPSFSVTAIDPSIEGFESVRSELAPSLGGWEYVAQSNLKQNAQQLAENAVKKLRAPAVVAGERDLIIAPSNLWLTIHESIGHATELDRALGYEMDMAGTSYATPDKLHKLRIGSPIVTFYADKTTPGGLATCAWDDDGVETYRWDLIKNGVFVDYQTTRDQAAWIHERKSRATSYAQDHKSVAFQRMPNVSLAPSRSDISVDDIIAATDDGIFATGTNSWSIDQQRYNFQFSAQMAYEIKKGKIVGPVRHFAYQSNSIQFWNSCDMIGGPKSWELGGAMDDGKGEPMQSNAVSHGCPPARFRRVNVLSTRNS